MGKPNKMCTFSGAQSWAYGTPKEGGRQKGKDNLGLLLLFPDFCKHSSTWLVFGVSWCECVLRTVDGYPLIIIPIIYLTNIHWVSVKSHHHPRSWEFCAVCAQSRLTVLQPYGPPGSSVHVIFQATILEWVAISYSRGSSQARDRTCISCPGRQILCHCASSVLSQTQL